MTDLESSWIATEEICHFVAVFIAQGIVHKEERRRFDYTFRDANYMLKSRKIMYFTL